MENFRNEKKEKMNEGKMTKEIESMTAELPSKTFLCTAIAAMAGAATLMCLGRKHSSLFVGQWVAPFLLFGIYNKIVKTQGHD